MIVESNMRAGMSTVCNIFIVIVILHVSIVIRMDYIHSILIFITISLSHGIEIRANISVQFSYSRHTTVAVYVVCHLLSLEFISNDKNNILHPLYLVSIFPHFHSYSPFHMLDDCIHSAVCVRCVKTRIRNFF